MLGEQNNWKGEGNEPEDESEARRYLGLPEAEPIRGQPLSDDEVAAENARLGGSGN